jgi:hypothetical protein
MTARVPLLKEQFLNPSLQSLYLHVSSYMVVTERQSRKIIAATNPNTKQRKTRWMRRFIGGPCRIRGKQTMNFGLKVHVYCKSGNNIVEDCHVAMRI